MTLFSVADVSRMWANIDVYESDLREIQVGQVAVFEVEGLPDELFVGLIDWVSSASSVSSNICRGWLGLGSISAIGQRK